MSLARVLRFLAGFLIASVLLFIVLPLVGIPPSKFLPPNLAYTKADGLAPGRVTKKEVQPTGNPFKVGDHIYLVDYEFFALGPLTRGETKPGPKQLCTGQTRVDEAYWGDADHPKKTGIQPGQVIRIRYDKTYPDINGIDSVGRGCGPGSNILSGWILFLVLDLVLGYLLMILVLERFGTKENI